VHAARQDDSTVSRDALEALCRTYWYPIYAFIRRRGYDPHQAEDLTQGFFAFLLESNGLERVDRAKGRFRSFLLAVLVNFLHNHHDHVQAAKRGGGYELLSWDQLAPEERYAHEPIDDLSANNLFERRWAFTLVERALTRLREDYGQGGRADLFVHLQPCLTADIEPGQYAILAGRLGLSEGAVKTALHRLRRQFGEMLRREVARTVARPEEIEDEIRHLLLAIAGGSGNGSAPL
jgi:DNA-directed RNA polymerase specialized sigma24 family protein